MIEADRIINAGVKPEEEAIDRAIRPKLLADYLACSNLAEVHILSPSDARRCADTYLALKLSFLPDVAPEAYWKLSVEQRWAAQKMGYAAFLRWKEANVRIAQSE